VERYAEYKDSGAPWIGEIPVDWQVLQLKFTAKAGISNGIFCEKAKLGDGVRLVNVSDLYSNNCIDVDNLELLDITETEYKKYRVLRNDLFYTRSSLKLEGIGHCNIVLSDEKMVYECHIMKISPNDTVVPKFVAYYSNSNIAKFDIIRKSKTATMTTINQQDLGSARFLLPPLSEQQAIADYLDRSTAQVDSLLADLQTQVNMLDRYKRELIANTITHGLDKSAQKKDSGVDWIGEVPTHWEVTKTKWIFEIVKRIYGKEDRNVLSITNRGLKIRDIESNEGQLAESYANYQVVNVNDFAMNSMDLLTGWVDCSPFEGVTSPDYRVFRFFPNKQQCHNYYKYLFQMCYKSRIFYRLGQGVSNLGRWRLQADQFLNMKLPQPPIHEQEEIAAFLDKKTAQVDGLIADINEQIDKLKQYRQIVIHDAVTGKVKVSEGNGNGD